MDRKDKKVLTLGIFAHANAGKTTITEHLLYHAKVIDSIGRVDDGNTVTDHLKIEKERGITVRDSLVSFDLKDKTIQLIDTPGHVDFSAEVERAISVLDGAVFVISGVEGIEAQTFSIWKALQEKNIPVIFFINKMDRMGADYDRVLTELQKSLHVFTLTLTHVYPKCAKRLALRASTKEEMIEEMSKVDEDMLEHYINETELDQEFLTTKILTLTKNSKLFPVIGGSALFDIGINDLITAIENFIPPTNKKLEEKFCAFVYAINVDKNGKNAFIKVLTGSISIKDVVMLADERTEKINKMYLAEGSSLKDINTAYSGDIVIIKGLDVKCGELIGENKELNQYIHFINPLLTMEIRPKNPQQSIELMEALKILNEEDPYLNVKYNERTNSIYCSLMGEVQAQIIEAYLLDRFNIQVSIENPMVIHKETASIKARAKASYTSVSGVEIEVKPLARGEGFKYVSKISTSFLHLKYQRQIERLIKHYAKQGLYGWALTDMEVSLIDGQFDSMGSDPLHFNIAAPLALFRALKQAKIKLLEPIASFTIITPQNSLQALNKLLSQKSAIYQVTKNIDEIVTIEGEAPALNLLNFSVELAKITTGRATFSSQIKKYEISNKVDVKLDYMGADPRNETTFIINDMKSSLAPLDCLLMKKKKESKSKFARQQKEKNKGSLI